MSVTVTETNNTVTISGSYFLPPPSYIQANSAIQEAKSYGGTSTQLNYIFNDSVNDIEGAAANAGVWSNIIIAGGNTTNPNLMRGTTSLRTIIGGYNNIIGRAANTDVNEGINSQVLGGSHARIVMNNQDRTSIVSHGTIVGGAFNEITNGDFGIISGGRNNKIEEKQGAYSAGEYASVSNGYCAVISGGYGNSNSGYTAVVGGGYQNNVRLKDSVIAGGYSNNIDEPKDYATSASLEHSTIGGGRSNNIFATTGGTICGGKDNSINLAPAAGGPPEADGPINAGAYMSIGGGLNNRIARAVAGFPLVSDCSYSTIIGGWNNLVNNIGGTVIGGVDNQVQAAYATSFGRGAQARNAGGFVQGGQAFSAVGDAQSSVYVLKCQTTDATATEMQSMGTSLTMRNDTAWSFRALVVGRDSATNSSVGYEVKGLVHNDSGTAAIVGTVGVTTLGESSTPTNMSACDVTATVSGATLRIMATGIASTTIKWVCRLEIAEVTG